MAKRLCYYHFYGSCLMKVSFTLCRVAYASKKRFRCGKKMKRIACKKLFHSVEQTHMAAATSARPHQASSSQSQPKTNSKCFAPENTATPLCFSVYFYCCLLLLLLLLVSAFREFSQWFCSRLWACGEYSRHSAFYLRRFFSLLNQFST